MRTISAILLILLSVCNLMEGSIPSRPKEPASPEIIITDETFVLNIEEKYMSFKGKYTFYSTFLRDIKTKVSFPFYTDAAHPFPKNISMSNLTFTLPKSEIFKFEKDFIEYSMIFKAKGETLQSVTYMQEHKNNKAIYLFTANDLKKPLKTLKVFIYVPKNFKKVKINYKTKTPKEKNNYILYTIEEKNIIPDKNLIVEWEK